MYQGVLTCFPAFLNAFCPRFLFFVNVLTFHLQCLHCILLTLRHGPLPSKAEYSCDNISFERKTQRAFLALSWPLKCTSETYKMGQTGHMLSMKLENIFSNVFFLLRIQNECLLLEQTRQVTDQTVKSLSLLNNSFLESIKATIMSNPKSNKHVSSIFKDNLFETNLRILKRLIQNCRARI